MEAMNMNTYLQTQYNNSARAMAADTASKSIGGINKNSSREEIEGAVKDFETFMMEKVMKEVKKSFVGEDDKSDTVGMYKDLYMDKVVTEMASKLVDDIGGDITDDFVDQIMRNYGISDTKTAAQQNAVADDVKASEDIAQTNTSTVTGIQA